MRRAEAGKGRLAGDDGRTRETVAAGLWNDSFAEPPSGLRAGGLRGDGSAQGARGPGQGLSSAAEERIRPRTPPLADFLAHAVYQCLERSGPIPPPIVPGHGATLGRDGFDWQIAYLRALIEGVRRSVGRGDSLDAAKEAVGLPAFADYALFEWVHYEVNLPAAYEEARASR